MNIQDIYEYASAGDLQGLELLSIEGGIYLLQAQVENRLHAIKQDDGSVLRLRSVTEARELLEGLRAPVPFHLVHCEAHGEMCGCEAVNEPIREPIALRSRW